MKRLNMITLGVKDLDASTHFYRELFVWQPEDVDGGIVFFDMGGWRLALFPWDALAEDAMQDTKSAGFRGITLAHNVPNKEDVAPMLRHAQALGAILVKEAQDVFWGGHSGYFQDPNGHLWEVAHNPFTPMNNDGTLVIG